MECSNFVNNAENDVKVNPQNLWRFINLKKNNTSIPGNLIFHDELENPQETVLLNFAALFLSIVSSIVNRPTVINNTCLLCYIIL